MDVQEILNFCLERGLLVDKDILNLFREVDTETGKILIEKIIGHTKKRFITKHTFDENKEQFKKIFLELPEENRQSIEKLKIKLGLSIEISKEISKESLIQEKKEVRKKLDEFNDIRILSMTPALSKKLEVKDFVRYFRNRFSDMKSILQGHSELGNLISINKISGNRQGASIIGLVIDKRATKNKNLLIDIEDLTGEIKVLINHDNKELFEKAKDIALDSVIGVKGSGNREIIFASDIILPEAMLFNRKKSESDEWVLFTGDMHVGSKLFMEKNFLRFIDYLNGKVPNTPEVEKIKYLFLIGDLIAGVGIYPGQEEELIIPEVEAQYAKVAELLGKIRKDIKIIISPGNHDALRIMEPQPLLDEKYAWPLYNLKNIVLTGNPAYLNIGSRKAFPGFNVLTYHGYSFHYYAGNIESLVKEKAAHKPEMIMSYLLKNRHLAPTHTSTLYFPSERDPFLIKEVPDIFISGHTHKSAINYYNNILLVSSSTWESLTAFQEKMGNEPDFCKVPMFNLKTRQVKILDFEGEEEK
ncbi:MAG: metallophosphoesterase [Nanoarchaeota archaeon]